MRRAKKVAVPEEEEVDEFDFDEEMDDGDMEGMALEDLLSPEEIQVLEELAEAVDQRDLEKVKQILAKAVSVDMKKEILVNAPTPDSNGTSVLMMAFELGELEIAKYLLENGGEASVQNEDGDTCFTLACAHGHVKLVELLLEKGIVKLFGALDDEGNGALHLAAQGHVDTLRLLLEKGAFLNVPAGETKATALHIAVGSGKVENVKLLLEKGADVTKMTASGYTPLMCCVGDAQLEPEVAIAIATLLLGAKADVNKVNSFGATAYDLAEAEGEYAFARFLLEKGAVPRGVPANTIGVQDFSTTVYYQTGTVPRARTRAASVVLGNMLYVGGGLRARTVEEVTAELEALSAGKEDEEQEFDMDGFNMLPFSPMSDLYATDLTKIGMQPLAELSKIKGVQFSLSHQLKGDHISFESDGTVVCQYVPDECEGCDDKDCETKQPTDEAKGSCASADEDSFVTSVMTEEGFNAEQSAISYAEVTFLEDSDLKQASLEASIGLTVQPGEWEFDRHPGWIPNSIGYHSDDGKVRTSLPEEGSIEMACRGITWGLGDTVGVGYIWATKECFFTLNGRFLGVPLVVKDFEGDDIRLIVGCSTSGLKFRANLGTRPFRFNFHVPTINWTKLNDLPDNIVALLPLPGSTEEMLVIPDATNAVYHYNPTSQTVQVQEIKSAKLSSIPLHAEHAVYQSGNKVVLFARFETLLDPGKRKNALLLVLDLTTKTWTDLLSPINMAQKKLAKALQDTQAALSAAMIGNNFYIFTSDKAYQLNLVNLALTAVKLNGLPPNEDMAFTNLSDTRSLVFAVSPDLVSNRFNLVDMSAKQYYLPRFPPSLLEPVVGKSIAQWNGKYFAFGGFSSNGSSTKNYLWSFTNATSEPRGLAAAFNDATYSDFTVTVGEQKLALHKAVLSARSSVFAQHIAGGSSEYAVASNLHANSAVAVLKYLYSDSIDISLVTAKDYKTVLEAIRALAPVHEERIIEELMFTRTIAASRYDKDIASLVKQEEIAYSDLTIDTKDGQVKAHRVILAARSPALKELIGTGNTVKLNHGKAAVTEFVKALYAVCSYNIADAPSAVWDELSAIGAELKTCCLEKVILAAKTIPVDEVPLAQ